MKKAWIYLLLAALLVIALTIPAAAADASTPHCYCGGTSATGHKVNGCTGNLNQPWTAYTGSTLPATAGYYYLKSDITGCGQAGGANGVTGNIYLDLNGHIVQMDASSYAFLLNSSANVTITDFVGTGVIKADGSGEHAGGVIRVNSSNAKLNIYGGKLDANGHDNSTSSTPFGGTIANSGGTLNIYGGTIVGGTANHGGAIYSSGKLNIYGGTIVGGTATGSGGGTICAERCTFNMSGGTISGGTATTSSSGGGAVALYTNTVFTMTGGTISGGSSLKSGDLYGGGNIYINSGTTFNMQGGTITGGVGVRGGNICNLGKLNISGGVIENGKATAADRRHGGGNVYQGYHSTAPTGTMTGGTLRNGTAANSGGNFCMRYGTFTMSGGTMYSDITDTRNATDGANAAVTYWTATFNMTGGKIYGGYASEGASGIAIPYDGGKINISGDAVIEGGKAKYGCALYIDPVTTGGNVTREINISGGTITGGEVTGSGGGTICIEAGVTNITGGTINGGTTPDNSLYGGGTFAIVGDDAVMNISGGIVNSGTANIGACGSVHHGTLNLTGGTVAGVSLFGGKVNVSGKPTATVAVASGQYVTIPSALTGGQVRLTSDNFTKKVATAANPTIADVSLPYLYSHYYIDGDGTTGTISNLITMGADVYCMGAIQYDTAQKTWIYDKLYRLDTKEGGEGLIYKLVCPTTYSNLNLAAGTVIDLNGWDLTVTGEANLAGVLFVDSATSNYDSSNGYGKLKVSTMIGTPARVGLDPTNQYRYVTILDQDGNYSAHRIYVTVKSAVLTPGGPSINFKTVFKCNQTIASLVSEYGAAFTGDRTLYSKSNKSIATGNDNLNEWLTKLSNASANYFSRTFATQAYFTLNDNWPVASEKTVTSSTMTRSIQNMVEYANSIFTSLSMNQQKSLVAMYNRFTSVMEQGWNIQMISSRANAILWSGAALPTETGYYKIEKDYTVTSVAKPANNADIWLDLNGYTVTGTASGMYDLTGSTGVSLNIYDASDVQTGTLTAPDGCTVAGAIVNMDANNTFTLHNGTLDGSKVTVAGTKSGGSGAAIYSTGVVNIKDGTVIGGKVTGGYVYNGGGAVSISGEDAKLIMTGGKIQGGETVCGGAVLVQNGALLQMSGGEITGATANYDGGNVFSWSGNLEMSGGKITGGNLGKYARYGTNVCLWGNSTMNMTGGAITGGTATGTTAYGGVYVNSNSTITVSGNVNITGNTYNDAPSNLFFNGSMLNIGTAGLKKEGGLGISVQNGTGTFTSGEQITAAATKYFSADNGEDLLVSCNIMAVGGFGYQVGYAEGNYGQYVVGIGLSGYGNDAERLATSADSYGLDIEVLAVTDNEGDTAIICSVEAATIATSFHTQLRELVSATYNIPVENVMISSNHQHSTPVPGSTASYCDYETFNQQFKELFMETVAKAIFDRQDAQVYSQQVATSGYNFVRNCMAYNSSNKYLGMVTDNHVDFGASNYSYVLEETGAGDRSLQLVWFDRLGKDIVVANFQTHPHSFTGGGSSNTVASAGFTGVFRDLVSDEKDCHTMYISGASGDMNMMPREKLKTGVGGTTMSGKGSLSAYASGLAGLVPELTASKWNKLETGQVAGTSYNLTLNTNKDKADLYPVALTISSAGNNSAKTAALRSAMSGVTDPSKYIYSIYHADAIVNRHSAGATRQMPVYAISIGDISFGGVPYEMFSADGKTVKSGDTHPVTIVASLANGHNGYVPSTTHMTNGGYSADIAYVAKGSSDQLNSKLMELLNQLREANNQ